MAEVAKILFCFLIHMQIKVFLSAAKKYLYKEINKLIVNKSQI